MKKTIRGALGMAACFGLVACTALTSTKDASSMAQGHDARMRMRHGQLIEVNGNNYGRYAEPAAQYPQNSQPANANTTATQRTIGNPTAGNQPVSQMPAAPSMPQPDPTAGNYPPEQSRIGK